MTTDTARELIEKLKNEEKTQQAAAKKKREEFNQAVELVKASKSVDDTVSFLTGQMLETKDQAEDKMVTAQDAEDKAQKAIGELEKAAEVANNAVKTEDEKKKALDAATKDLEDAEKAKNDKEKKFGVNPDDATLKKELEDANTKFAEKKTEMEKAKTNLQDATNEKNRQEDAFKAAKLIMEQALKNAKEAREEEEKILLQFDKLNKGVDVVRSISSNAWSRFVDKITPEHAINFSLVAVGGIGIWVLSAVVSDNFLRLIQYVDVARGLITFMVAMITVTLAIVLSIYPIISSDNKDAKTDIKERFMLGKEVLMVFVGILGTIVGFYYASDHKGVSGGEQSISNFFISPSELQADGDFTLTMLVAADSPPYKYEISSKPDGIEKSGVTIENFIQVPLKAPASIQEDTIYTINLKVTDSTDNQIFESKKPVKVKKPSPVAPPAVPASPP